jgi:23S rRNA (uracil747-C5)-methyltransferase
MKCHDFLHQHCRSCDLLSEEYSSSVKIKERQLQSLFPDHISKIKKSIVCNEGAGETRNKAKLAVAQIDQEIQFGFYDNGIQFKKLENCPLQISPINKILIPVRELLLKYKIIPYSPLLKTGELKYLLITYSSSSDELLLRFVLRSKESLDRLKKMTEELKLTNPQVSVVTANIQSVHQAILEGEEEILLTENTYITHQFDEYKLFQGARSFFQTNTKMASALYQSFQTEIKNLDIKKLLDLYCGVGAFSFYAEKYCKQIIGIEISKEAIEFANLAKQINQVSHVDFQALDAEMYLNTNTERFDAVVVNPPRRGLNEQIINQLLKIAPDYIFYSSCNVETLARDWEKFQTGYQINSLQIFDMFPFTSHFETLMVLSKKKD